MASEFLGKKYRVRSVASGCPALVKRTHDDLKEDHCVTNVFIKQLFPTFYLLKVEKKLSLPVNSAGFVMTSTSFSKVVFPFLLFLCCFSTSIWQIRLGESNFNSCSKSALSLDPAGNSAVRISSANFNKSSFCSDSCNFS